MIFLFGERLKRESKPLGTRDCPVCRSKQDFNHVRETNYFHCFGLRLLPLEKIADYQQCELCENAFTMQSEGVPELPSQIDLTHAVIAYVLVGYGMQDHLDVALDIANKVTGIESKAEDLQSKVRQLASGQVDLFDWAKRDSARLNARGKQQVIEAAFLATHACCEIQYEDRLRINLIANAMDASIAFVNATIEHVRRQACYGVRRLLPTQTQV